MRHECLMDLKVQYLSHTEHPYTDLLGNDQKELLITYETTEAPEKIILFRDPFCMVYHGTVLKLRLPILNAELKRFFENYKDYCYLPDEDTCILKELAGGVDPAHIQNAKKETCYIRYRGLFIPQLHTNVAAFRQDYKSRITYQIYDPGEITKEFSEEIAPAVIGYLNR